MQKSNIFQIVVIGTFVVLIILGFLGFSGKLPLPTSSQDVNYGTITMWGTVPDVVMQQLIGNTLSKDKRVNISYVEKNKDTIDRDFVDSLASGDGPDLIVISQDKIQKTLDKLTLIPYQSLSEQSFKSTFLPEGEMFLRPNGIVALPFTVDPLVMYWNRDIFTNALVVTPPSLWTQFYDLVPKITVRNQDGSIARSLVSFGEYQNVSHAKEVVSLLLMQAGSSIVSEQKGQYYSALTTSDKPGDNPVVSALRFYTEFSKPEKDAYSWNRSLPMSRSMFESGDLALYLGYASEYKSIQNKNPHLNFDVALAPQAGATPGQSDSLTNRLTFGVMQGVAISRSTKNAQGAFYAAQLLTSKDSIAALNAGLGLPPVRDDLINVRSTDAAQNVFYDSAILARAWPDPSPDETNAIFMRMLDSITSGRSMISDALGVASRSLSNILSANRQ